MSYNYLFKFLIIGNENVGKTSICKRMSGEQIDLHYDQTIGVEFSTCLKPIEMVRQLRQIVVDLGWTYERIEAVRTVDRFAIIIPLTQLAKSLGIKITSGPFKGMEMLSWSQTPGSSGSLHYTSWCFSTKIKIGNQTKNRRTNVPKR